MLLSELITKNREEKITGQVHGVIVDEYNSEILDNVDELGFLLQLNEEGTYLSDDLLDVILDYQYKDTNTLIEIPFGSNVSPSTLHYCANTTGASLSLLPPETKKNGEVEEYKNKLVEMTKFWLESPNTEYQLLPSTGYFEYLIKEALGIKATTISTDEYMIKNFVVTLTIEEMDNIKDEIKTVFTDILGGDEALKEYAQSVALGLAEATSELCDDIIHQIEEQAAKSEEPQTEQKDTEEKAEVSQP